MQYLAVCKGGIRGNILKCGDDLFGISRLHAIDMPLLGLPAVWGGVR